MLEIKILKSLNVAGFLNCLTNVFFVSKLCQNVVPAAKINWDQYLHRSDSNQGSDYIVIF